MIQCLYETHALTRGLTGWLQLPTCDEVEFWKAPEKTGWLYSQGEVIKTWRRRWFVLKEGWLFRFAESDVKPSSKPRGVVDMTLVTNVIDGREATGKPNSIKLTTSTGGQVSTTLRISCRAPGDFAGY